MNAPKEDGGELRESAQVLRPHVRTAFAFALVAALLVLAPTFYMFEVYDRVVNSRSLLTLGMLTLAVLFLILASWRSCTGRSTVMLEATRQWEIAMRPRLVQATFDLNLRRGSGGSPVQPMNDCARCGTFWRAPSRLP
jgi:ATP-binding cassette, subfamily C, bacterial exporter for protease/lipase